MVVEALPTTEQVKLINKQKFARVALNRCSETFVIYVTSLKMSPELFGIIIYLL